MSSQEDADYAGVVDEFNNLLNSNYCNVAVIAFLVFDWLLGLQWEISLFWTGASIGATSLYAATRYMTLLANVIYVIQFSQMSDGVSQLAAFSFARGPTDELWGWLAASRRCTQLVWTTFALSFFASLPLLVLAVLRVYALTGHKPLTMFTLLVLSAPVACFIVPYTFSATGMVTPLIGCMEADLTSVDLYTSAKLNPLTPQVVVVGRIFGLAADVLLLVVTYWTSPQRGNVSCMLKNGGKTLSSVMLYNGLIYFVALTVLDTLHLVLSVLAIEDLGGSSVVVIFRDPMASVLVSRFLLDLQDAYQRSVMLDSHHPISTVCVVDDDRTIRFARVAGSLGATIEHDTVDDFGEFECGEDLEAADCVIEDDDGGNVYDLKV